MPRGRTSASAMQPGCSSHGKCPASEHPGRAAVRRTHAPSRWRTPPGSGCPGRRPPRPARSYAAARAGRLPGGEQRRPRPRSSGCSTGPRAGVVGHRGRGRVGRAKYAGQTQPQRLEGVLVGALARHGALVELVGALAHVLRCAGQELPLEPAVAAVARRSPAGRRAAGRGPGRGARWPARRPGSRPSCGPSTTASSRPSASSTATASATCWATVNGPSVVDGGRPRWV